MGYDIERADPSNKEFENEHREYITNLIEEMREKGVNPIILINKGNSFISAGSFDEKIFARHLVALFVNCPTLLTEVTVEMRRINRKS